MIKKILFISLVLISSQITGCATTYYPVPEGYTGPTTPIIDSYQRVTATKVMFYELTHVDDREV